MYVLKLSTWPRNYTSQHQLCPARLPVYSISQKVGRQSHMTITIHAQERLSTYLIGIGNCLSATIDKCLGSEAESLHISSPAAS